MAKSDSFFIRAKVTSNGTTFAQEEIDLGSFVNLGVSKSTLLRIHGVDVSCRKSSGYPGVISENDNTALIGWHLATQSQSDLIGLDDKAAVATGDWSLYIGKTEEDGTAAGDYKTNNVIGNFDLNPRDFKNGYLIGVDTMYLGVESSQALTTGEVNISIVMECTLETATQASSTALALSQQ